MITIRFSGRTPSPRAISIGQETDSNADKLRFILPEIANGQIATLQMILPDGTPDAVEIEDGMITIPARMAEIAGRTRAWVEILAGDVTAWHSEILYLEVGELPPISERTEQQYPTAFQDAIAATLGNKQAAEAAQEAAELAQSMAEQAAAMAAAGGGVLQFEIEHGDLVMYCTDDTPYDFRLEDGRLVVYGDN